MMMMMNLMDNERGWYIGLPSLPLPPLTQPNLSCIETPVCISTKHKVVFFFFGYIRWGGGWVGSGRVGMYPYDTYIPASIDFNQAKPG